MGRKVIKMPTNEIEEFARKLITAVRDEAIKSCDANTRPAAQNVIARRWLDARAAGEAETVMVPDTVDEALFFLLTAIDQGILRLSYTTDEGRTVDLSEEGMGELAGWYIGPDGWRDRYSSELGFESVPDTDAP